MNKTIKTLNCQKVQEAYKIHIVPPNKKQYKKFNLRSSSYNDSQNINPNIKLTIQDSVPGQCPTFGNWNHERVHILKSRQNKLSCEHKNDASSSRSSSRHKPRFPKNNKIIKQFIIQTQQQPDKITDVFSSIEQKQEMSKSFRKMPLRRLTQVSNLSQNIQNNQINYISRLNKSRQLQLQKKSLKEKFIKIYIKQKERYEKILYSYGINQKVNDDEFYRFIEIM